MLKLIKKWYEFCKYIILNPPDPNKELRRMNSQPTGSNWEEVSKKSDEAESKFRELYFNTVISILSLIIAFLSLIFSFATIVVSIFL